MDRIAQEVTPLGTIDYTYDAVGRRKTMQVLGQNIVNYDYYDNGWIENIRQVVNSIEQRFNFVYDDGGRRERLKSFNGASLVTETIYGFDNANRLLNLEHLNPLNQILESIGYTYDPNGNRITMNRPSVTLPMPNQASNTSYNEANQMLSFNDKNIVYDNNGNMASVTNSCGTTTYTWDVRNRLVGINGFKPDCSSLTALFKYDALGRRIEKTINGTTTQYVYDGLDIIQELNQDGSLKANYIRGLNIDEPLMRVKSDGSVRCYQTDALGSVIALTDENGVIKTQYTYDPFGAVTISGESSDNPFQFAGRENDGDGHLFERNRYYSYELMRYISQDPIGLAGGDVNYYVRVGNNPVNFVDPLGLWRWPWSIYNDATIDAENKFPNSLHNGMGDAYRHCLASCMMTKENGVVSAESFGWANEKRGDWTHNQQCGERSMDDINNQKGRDIGLTTGNTSDCATQCLNAANRGNLKTYTSGTTPGYWY